MSAEDLAYIDGVDVYDLGLELTAMPSVWASASMGWSAISIPQRAGLTLTGELAEVGAKRIVLRAKGKFADASTAETSLHTLRDAVIDRLCGLSFAHATGRSRYGVLDEFAIEHFAPLALPGWVEAELGFLCPDPYAVDDTETTATGIAAERVTIQVGTGPTYPTVTVLGAATTPVLTLRDHGGTSIGTMTAATLAAGDFWRVTTLDGLSEKSVSGVWSNNLGDLTAGYRFPVILPRYANRASSSWPTLETSAGTLSVSYARRWA